MICVEDEYLIFKESIELLNTLTYKNYGLLLNSNSIDISISNRLAICTDKSIFILNQNFEWPSAFNDSCPFKFFLNNKKSQNKQSKQQIQIDQWIQDLVQSKNDAYFINIIRSVPKSTKFLSIFKQFFNLDEYRQSKHKSFQKQLQFMCKRSSENDTKASKLNDNLKENNAKGLQEENPEEFGIHKTIFDQTKIFDLDFYEFLSYLNPHSSGTAQENNLQDSFKLCKWNTNPNRQLLFTLTHYNQMLLFDCTKIKFNNTVNHLNSDETINNNESEYIKIFDLKSKSKMINLTDFIILNHNSNLLSHRFRNLDDFMQNLSKIIPKTISWGPRVYLRNNQEYEILIIGFKSNQIGVFHVYSNLKLELFRMVNIKDKIINNLKQDESIDTNISNSNKCILSEIKVCENGILCVGLNDGRIFYGLLEDPKLELIGTLLGSIEKIDFIRIDDDSYLVLALTIGQLGFFLVNNKGLQSSFLYELNEERYANYIQQPVKNYLTQGSFRIIDFKILKNLNFLLIFENCFIDSIEIKIQNLHIEFVKNKILNNSIDINFDPKLNVNQSEVFKSTRQAFMSRNNLILYQINDFTKLSLVQKRPANFQVNVYRLKNLTVELIGEFLNPKNVDFNQKCLLQVNDFIWLFKHDLYLKNETLTAQNFSFIYEHFKTYRLKINNFVDVKEKLVYLKRIRILARLMRDYFDAVSNFDVFNSKIEADEVDESSEESDYRDEDEMETEVEFRVEEVKVEAKVDTVVKSVSFYDLIFRETSLLIFKFFCIEILSKAHKVGYENLELDEKMLVINMGDFCIRKNFLQNQDNSDLLEKWLKEKSIQSSETNELNELLNKIRCDFCSKRFTVESNLNLTKIKCDTGHYMNRCEKTLFPLNNFKHKKCFICDSKWNYIEIQKGLFKNFDQFLLYQLDNCLYCD